MPVRFGRPLATRRWNRSLGKHICWTWLACASQFVWDFRMVDVDMWLDRQLTNSFLCQADLEPWPSSIQRPWYLQEAEMWDLTKCYSTFCWRHVTQWPRMLGMGFGFEESKLCLEARQKAFPRFDSISLRHAIYSTHNLFISHPFSHDEYNSAMQCHYTLTSMSQWVVSTSNWRPRLGNQSATVRSS